MNLKRHASYRDEAALSGALVKIAGSDRADDGRRRTEIEGDRELSGPPPDGAAAR